ncbi:MAG: DUF4838 domain-containing protein [Bryobacteraceae bacterium]|nr:DUF4838 domain-containing protein [Bryobacterales bacterium]NUN01269.1 DUF4838 domain-containing protein [Bryobacteraceae bacterium]
MKRPIPILCAVALAAPATPLDLVRNGQSVYSIVIAPDASASERHGAEELQKFLEEISGARLPVTTESRSNMVLVGRSPALNKLKLSIDFDDLGPEGFALKTAGKHLVIAGGRLRGTMYGVYSFLEKLGCRWFTPEVSRIPKMRTVSVRELEETQKPAFEYREPFFAEASDADWAARNKANGMLMKLDAARGGKIRYFPFVHSFEALVPPKRYFKDHPEYFSLIDGRRRAERSQLCLTNPDVLRVGIESVERWIAEHPEANILSVSQNDWTGWCECDNCRRVEEEEGGSHSGPLLRYINALAAEIEKKYPDKLIDTLAYWYTEDPPLKTRPRRNVRIRLCPIGACEAHPYEQCRYNAYFMKNLRAWAKITNQLYIWHYNTNFAHYLLPFPDFDELAADIPMYHRNGVAGLFMEGSPSRAGGAENAELRSYVMARLLWDPGTDVERDIDEFHQAYYGEAARPMRAYFDLMHNEVRMPPRGKGHHIWIYDRPSAPYLNEEFLAKAAELFREAEAAASSGAVRNRIRKARLGIDYINLTRAKRFSVEGGWYRPANLNALKDRWQTFVTAVRSFGMTHISESTLLSKDEQDFETFVRPYAIASLENERLRVHVAPELAGRVTHIIDKRNGRDLLLHPEPGSKQYPNLGGLTVAPYADYVSRQPWSTSWSLNRNTARQELSLTGVSENGLELRRALKLEGSMLRTHTVLENRGSAPVELVLQSRWEVDPGSLEHVIVSYGRQDGATVEKQLIEPEKQPAGTEFYTGAEQPNGEWRVLNRAGGPVIVNRFAKDQVARCFLNWTAKSENRVALAVASPRRTLQPRETITLDADYGVK